MNAPSLHINTYEPGWAAGIADLADRAAAAFALDGRTDCFTVIDLQPWRLLDAWWLRRCLEPLAHLSGRPVRYVPCIGPAFPRGQSLRSIAPAWSVGAAGVELNWPDSATAPKRKGTNEDWPADGPILLLAGDLAQRLPQDLLLSHHGKLSEWAGTPPAAKEWQRIEPARYADWIAKSVTTYLHGLPSSMFSLPLGYYQFLEHAFAWASSGCIVVARAEGWASLAQIREDAATHANVSADRSPVNFKWLADHASRLNASTHTVRACRADMIQVMAGGLPGGDGMLQLVCKPLADATRSTRGDVARAIRVLATNGETRALLSVLQQSADDPMLFRAVWEQVAAAAASAKAADKAQLGAWLERLMHDNPWICDDEELLRATGHVALACELPGLSRTTLQTLHEKRRTLAADLAVLARAHEKLGALDAALAACDLALLGQPANPDALATRERISARRAETGAWKVQYSSSADAPLLFEPLHAGHASVLAHQLRDPSIATMTVLPVLAEGDDGTAWIQARHDDGGHVYAIVHRQLGFIGSFEFRVWETTAFVSCWIGPDFQGLGLFVPSLALGCNLAWHNGIDLILTAAFDDNERPLRGQRRCGFRRMDVRALPPDDDRTFVMLSGERAFDDDEALQRLVDFCTHTNSGLRFAAQTDTAPSETNPPGDLP